jgi:addiction module HigA family antidote
MEVPTVVAAEKSPRAGRIPKHPGTILQMQYMVPKAISINFLAERTRIDKGMLTAVVQGHKPITKWMAIRIAEVLGTTVEFWTMLQEHYSNYHTKRGSDAKGSVYSYRESAKRAALQTDARTRKEIRSQRRTTQGAKGPGSDT